MTVHRLFHLVISSSLVACGGGGSTGIDAVGDQPLISVGTSEINRLCELAVAAIGIQRTITCSDGDRFQIGGVTVASCAMKVRSDQNGFPDCIGTVSQYEACIARIPAITEAMVCDREEPDECQQLRNDACVPPTDYLIDFLPP